MRKFARIVLLVLGILILAAPLVRCITAGALGASSDVGFGDIAFTAVAGGLCLWGASKLRSG